MAFHRVWSPSTGQPERLADRRGRPRVGPRLEQGASVRHEPGQRARRLRAVNTDALEHFVAPGVGDKMLFVPTAYGVEAFRTTS